MIAKNIRKAQEKIDAACRAAGRESGDVTLIAVSKTKPLSMVQEAYDAGCRDFGENKVQELTEKQAAMPGDIRWHMIGHLQRNKVKYLVGNVYLIHSVDSLRLAQEISRQSVKKQVTTSILVEVNIADEATKFGVTSAQEVCRLVEQIAALPAIAVKGLMTVAPYTENPEENRQYFRALKQLSVDIMQKNIDNVDMGILSMGMTGDYQVAVSEGATCVRIGTGIFGERDYVSTE